MYDVRKSYVIPFLTKMSCSRCRALGGSNSAGSFLLICFPEISPGQHHEFSAIPLNGILGQAHHFVCNLPSFAPVGTQRIAVRSIEHRDSVPFCRRVIDTEPYPLQIIEEHGVVLEPGASSVEPTLLYRPKY